MQAHKSPRDVYGEDTELVQNNDIKILLGCLCLFKINQKYFLVTFDYFFKIAITTKKLQ